MAKVSVVPTGHMLGGGAPPDKMTEEERHEWAVHRSIESAKAIGGVPTATEKFLEE